MLKNTTKHTIISAERGAVESAVEIAVETYCKAATVDVTLDSRLCRYYWSTLIVCL